MALRTKASDRGDGAAVDDVLGADDGRGPVGDEEGHQLGNFFRLVGAAEGDAAQGVHDAPSAASVVMPASSEILATRWSAADVWTKPGETVLTRTPCGATSLARPLL